MFVYLGCCSLSSVRTVASCVAAASVSGDGDTRGLVGVAVCQGKKHGNTWYEVRRLLRRRRWRWRQRGENVLTSYCGLAVQAAGSLLPLSGCSGTHLQRTGAAGSRRGPWRQSSAQARAPPTGLGFGSRPSPAVRKKEKEKNNFHTS